MQKAAAALLPTRCVFRGPTERAAERRTLTACAIRRKGRDESVCGVVQNARRGVFRVWTAARQVSVRDACALLTCSLRRVHWGRRRRVVIGRYMCLPTRERPRDTSKDTWRDRNLVVI